jgi:hypothetical protein
MTRARVQSAAYGLPIHAAKHAAAHRQLVAMARGTCQDALVTPSWRSAASQEAQADLDGLVNATLPFAQQMLERHGEFFPFAAAVTSDGAVELLGTDPGTDYRPASTEALDQLVGGLRDRVGSLRAAALVADVRTGESDAVRVELEHRDGHAICVLLPYRKLRLRRGIDYGDLHATPGQHRIWRGG